MNADPISAEEIALEKLRNIFEEARKGEDVKKKEIEITFLAQGKKYKGLFEFGFHKDKSTKKGAITFENPCSYLQYTYGKNFPYSTRINANRRKDACFTPRLVGPSADVLQILSTKLRLQIPEHEPITIIDEAKKDGVSISKAKLIRGLPSIYEKYGYESKEINYIKGEFQKLKVSILSEDLKEIIEEKAGIPIGANASLIDVMKRISPEKEYIENSNPPFYISNVIYDKAYKYIYLHSEMASFFLRRNPEFVLVFNEYSDAWKAIKDKIQILDVLDVSDLRKILFVQLPDTIRERVMNIDDEDEISDDSPILDILDYIKEKDESLAQYIYKYTDNYLKKRRMVEILMNMPLNPAHEKYRIGDLSPAVRAQFYEIFYKSFNYIEEEPFEIDDSMYIADLLRTLKEEVPDYHFDKLYGILYDAYGEEKWENQNQVGGRRKSQHKKKTKRRQRKGKTKRRVNKN